MHTFKELSCLFNDYFREQHFPEYPQTLYGPCEYFLSEGGKRLRPVMCLMANELFSDIKDDSYLLATAIELFHNFSLIHDDIMDKAEIRRGRSTVCKKYGENTALLSGDVMLVRAYEYLGRISGGKLPEILCLFSKTAREVCEGQQLDMDFEVKEQVLLDEYIEMIALKTSVLLATSLETGAIIGGADAQARSLLYALGKNIGIAFQIQDDYLDSFGDEKKFGKAIGGDIRQNKKTFLMLYALSHTDPDSRQTLHHLMEDNPPDKVPRVLEIYRYCQVDQWAKDLKNKYLLAAIDSIEQLDLPQGKKQNLLDLAFFMVKRDY